MDQLHEKKKRLEEWLRANRPVAIAFSSGVDSTFLLKAAHDVLGDDVMAITAKSESFPQREYLEAEEFCRKEGIRQIICETSELEIDGFAANPPNRCYLCKKTLFTKMKEIAASEGIRVLAEGSNMDDLGDYRPGLQAIAELNIASPLRACELTKQEIRDLSKEMGLSTFDKPSFACLSSRFVYGETITAKKLRMVEEAEEFLLQKGFSQIRVRMHGETLARIETTPEEFDRLASMREEVAAKMKEIGFSYAAVDLTGYKTGSMNRDLGMLQPSRRERSEETEFSVRTVNQEARMGKEV